MSRTKSCWNKGDSLLLEKKNVIGEVNYHRLHLLFTNLALNRFTWNNLPKGIEGRHIERALLDNGQCCFFEDDELGLICLPCSNSNEINVYGDPLGVVAHGVGYTKALKSSDVIRVLNNDSCLPTMIHINYYTHKIYEIDKAIHRNLIQQKRPFVIATTKENELTMRNIMKDIREDVEEIFVDNKLSNGGNVGANVLNTNVPYLLDKYQQHKNDLMCEFLTIMGLNNTGASNNKKERLIVDEVNVNNNEILMYLDIDYKNRLIACKRLNEKYNLNVTVEKNISNLTQSFIRGDFLVE